MKDRLFYSYRGSFCIESQYEEKEQVGAVTNLKSLSFTFYYNFFEKT